jgi:general secretion pathway protein M
MRTWLDALPPREKMMILAAAAFAVIALLYFALWLPLDRGHRNATARVDDLRLAIVDLRPLRGQLQASGSATPGAGGQNQSLVVIIDTTLRQRSLYNALQRSQPTAANGIRVEFENVAFDGLMLWLGDLSNNYGMQLQSGSFSSSSEENVGRVNSSLTLER